MIKKVLLYTSLLLIIILLGLLIIPLFLKLYEHVINKNKHTQELQDKIQKQVEDISKMKELHYKEFEKEQQMKLQKEIRKHKEEERILHTKAKYKSRAELKRENKAHKETLKVQDERAQIQNETTDHKITTYEQYPIISSQDNSMLYAIEYNGYNTSPTETAETTETNMP